MELLNTNAVPTTNYEPGIFKFHKLWRKEQFGENGITAFLIFTPVKFYNGFFRSFFVEGWEKKLIFQFEQSQNYKSVIHIPSKYFSL